MHRLPFSLTLSPACLYSPLVIFLFLRSGILSWNLFCTWLQYVDQTWCSTVHFCFFAVSFFSPFMPEYFHLFFENHTFEFGSISLFVSQKPDQTTVLLWAAQCTIEPDQCARPENIYISLFSLAFAVFWFSYWMPHNLPIEHVCVYWQSRTYRTASRDKINVQHFISFHCALERAQAIDEDENSCT